jgi:hypothetical protein
MDTKARQAAANRIREALREGLITGKEAERMVRRIEAKRTRAKARGKA